MLPFRFFILNYYDPVPQRRGKYWFSSKTIDRIHTKLGALYSLFMVPPCSAHFFFYLCVCAHLYMLVVCDGGVMILYVMHVELHLIVWKVLYKE